MISWTKSSNTQPDSLSSTSAIATGEWWCRGTRAARHRLSGMRVTLLSRRGSSPGTMSWFMEAIIRPTLPRKTCGRIRGGSRSSIRWRRPSSCILQRGGILRGKASAFPGRKPDGGGFFTGRGELPARGRPVFSAAGGGDRRPRRPGNPSSSSPARRPHPGSAASTHPPI